MAYPAALLRPPTQIYATATRVHSAAAFGSSLLVVAASMLAFRAARTRWARIGVRILLAAYLALLAGSAHLVRQDLVLNWRYQKALIRDVIRLAPDMEGGNAILIERSALRRTRHANSFAHGLPEVLRFVLRFPSDRGPAQLYRLVPGWREHIVTKDGEFELGTSTVFENERYRRRVRPDDVILLEVENGRLTRRSQLVLGERRFTLKSRPALAVPPVFEEGPLYELFSIGSAEDAVDHLRDPKRR
jgi:hypothetical protein